MTVILMPKLSDSMEEGTILSWLKATGDSVAAGDELLEIETDKSTVTYAAEEPGTLTTLVDEGATVAVGTPIASLGTAAVIADTDASAPTATDEAAEELPEPSGNDEPNTRGNGSELLGRPRSGRWSEATPLAIRAADLHGVALSVVGGTGPLGKITRSDVLRHAGINPSVITARPPAAPARSNGTGTAPNGPGSPAPLGSTRQEPTRLQQLIARRMTEAKSVIPHFQVQTEIVMDAAIALRADFKAISDNEDPVPSLNDIIIKASAMALRDHPLANGSYQDDSFVLHAAINVGMAVAADHALVVPTIFNAVGKSLGQIAAETRALAKLVRDGNIGPGQLEGGTFTVSNLGMFGMTAITPVINPPQAAILGVGALRETLVRDGGEIVGRQLLTLTLSCDHRILYGADAARFLARIRELLETPLCLVL
jgi:pyruvate dehydrogenase E2 component (dihydrolipoamide acetyltransferase)